VIKARPAYWNVSARVLVRAVVFDGLGVGHPAVTALLDVLAPIAVAELQYGEALRNGFNDEHTDDRALPEFPILDGPIHWLGTGILTEVTAALVGDTPAAEEIAVLSQALEGTMPCVPGSVVARALADAVNPGKKAKLSSELLSPFGFTPIGNPLDILCSAKVVAPGDVLRGGLAVLCALVSLSDNRAGVMGRRVA